MLQKKSATGQELFSSVVNYLNVTETKFFGLAYYLDDFSDLSSSQLNNPERSSSDCVSSDLTMKCYSYSDSLGYVSNASYYSKENINCLCLQSPTYAGFNPFLIDVPVSLNTYIC